MSLELPPVDSLTLIPTLACNLDCGHCPVLRGAFVTPLELALAAIDRVVAAGAPSLWLGFAGGEPFLESEFVLACSRRAAELCRPAGRPLALAATTNATRLTPALLDELGELGFNLSISIDGLPEVQSASRGRAATAAWPALRRALATPGLEVTASITMTPLTAPHLASTVAALLDAGVGEIDLTPDAAGRWARSDLDVLAAGLRQAAADCLRCGREPWPLTFMRPPPPDSGPMVCGAARRGLAVDPTGGVYGCPQLLPIRRWCGASRPSPMYEFYRIGTVTEIGSPAFEQTRRMVAATGLAVPIERRSSRRGACADCRFGRRCRPCPAVSIDLGLPVGLIPEALCDIYWAQLETLAELGLP